MENNLSLFPEDELNLVVSDEAIKKFSDLSEKFKDVINGVASGVISNEEYNKALKEYTDALEELSSITGHAGLSSFSVFLLSNVSTKNNIKHIRKHKGAYSIPDKVIDGVINNIIYGEKVLDACSFAGISVVTLYNRIKDRGYDNVKEFFKEQKRKLKEEK